MRIFLRAIVAIGALGLTTSVVTAQKEPVYRPGDGVTLPVATHEVTPQYTSDAMRERIKGSVLVEVTVTAKGEVTDVEVTRSLDKVYGLDDAAVKAAKQWKFEPGTKDGKPVAVRVSIEMTFTMGAQEQQVYKPGNGITLPVATKRVQATYTQEAKDAHVEGTVGLEVVVKSDGMVGDVKVARSLDRTYGLDDQAVTALKQWQFRPGTKDGKPVAVQVEVAINFTLK